MYNRNAENNLFSIQEEGDLRQTRAAVVDDGRGERAEREGRREGEAMDVGQCLTDSERKSQSEEEGVGERRRERRESSSSSSSRQVLL